MLLLQATTTTIITTIITTTTTTTTTITILLLLLLLWGEVCGIWYGVRWYDFESLVDAVTGLRFFNRWDSQCCLKCVCLGWDSVSASLVFAFSCFRSCLPR